MYYQINNNIPAIRQSFKSIIIEHKWLTYYFYFNQPGKEEGEKEKEKRREEEQGSVEKGEVGN